MDLSVEVTATLCSLRVWSEDLAGAHGVRQLSRGQNRETTRLVGLVIGQLCADRGGVSAQVARE